MENIMDVARLFLSQESMSHKKLQKLCYYAQAWCSAAGTAGVCCGSDQPVGGPEEKHPIVFRNRHKSGIVNPKGVDGDLARRPSKICWADCAGRNRTT